MGSPELSRRFFLFFTLGSALFTLYGSYVPFHFHARPWAETWGAFEWVWSHRIAVQSRSDALANLLLGVPVGFGLMGALGMAVKRFRSRVLIAIGLWPSCIVFATMVEFGQLYFPGRTCSATDIVAQSIGSALGLLGFALVGSPVTAWVERLAGHRRLGGPAGRWLLIVSGVILLAEWLPLDIITSPAGWYHRVRDGVSEGRVTLIPFEEWQRLDTAAKCWAKIETWLELVSLFFPAGLLLGHLRWSWWFVGVYAIGLALLGELGQLFVSRHPSVTDVILGTLGVLAGCALVRELSRHRDSDGRLSWPMTLVLGQALIAVLVVVHWQPFEFTRPEARRFLWIPFEDLQAKHYLGSLNDWLERLMLFMPWGVLVVARGGQLSVWKRRGIAASVGFLVTCVLEIGQGFLPDRLATTTATLSGLLGAVIGAEVTSRMGLKP
ncbi:MAG: VanZ family protein [Fimbriiglobus sp.]